MDNNDIKNAFERFSPTEEQKEDMYKSITGSQSNYQKRTPLRLSAKLAYSAAACLIVALVAAILLSGPLSNSSSSLHKPDNTQQYQASTPLENSSLPVSVENFAGFQGFILTAHVTNCKNANLSGNSKEEADIKVLKPDVKVLLAKYSLDMSSAPGLPFTVDIADADKSSDDVQSIVVSADYGVFNLWNRKTGVVSSAGQQATIGVGETVYWSPDLNKDEANVNKIIITVEAVANDTVIGRQNIYITQEEHGYYYATIGELEQLQIT